MSPSRSGAGRQGRGVVGDRLTSGKLFIGAASTWGGPGAGNRRRFQVPLMSAEEFSAYLRKTYPQLTEAELLQMCREAGYDLTPPLPAWHKKAPSS